MAIGGVVINFVAKTADAISDTNKLGRTLGNLGKTSGKAAGQAGGLFKTMAVGIPIVGGIAAGVAGAAVALVDMGKAALEDKKAADNLHNTLKKIPGVTQAMIDANDEWIDGMQLATLVSDTELRAAVSRLTLATGDLGEAQKLAALAADVAAGSGKNYAAVTAAMAKAAGGNTAALERMFPWLDKNKDGTVTLTEATTGLGNAYENAAEKAAANDPWKRLGIIWDELREALGTGLLPLIKKFGDWFANEKNRQRILDIVKAVAKFSQEAGVEAVRAIQRLIDWLQSPEGKRAMLEFRTNLAAIVAVLKLVAHWIANVVSWAMSLSRALANIKVPSWITRDQGGGGWGTGPQPGAATMGAATMGATTTAAGMPTTDLNIVVQVDQWGSARVTKRALEANDRRQGRKPGTALRVAW